MRLEQGVQRLRWRFSNNTSFKPNQTDLEAMNTILGWISSQKEISVLNQSLFAKMYIYQLIKEIRHNGTTIFDNHNQKEVSRMLSIPLEVYYERFHFDLHHNQLAKTFKDKLKEDITLEDLKEKFTLEIVTDKLNHMVSEAVNSFM